MEYILMNKNIELCKITIDPENYILSKVLDVYNIKAFPVGVELIKGQPQIKSLAKWWNGRAIPGSRIGVDSFAKRYSVNIYSLPFKNYGLSLSDQYWLNPVGEDSKQWSDINFFHNYFSVEMGKSFFDASYTSNDDDFFMTPDSTSNGMLPKTWIRNKDDNKLYLYKAGSGPFEQEPFNELIASKIYQLLGFDNYVEYKVHHENDRYFSVCENFINENTELVTASNMRLTKSPLLVKHENEYEFLLNCCNEFNIPNVKESLDVMLAVDYIICNDDRHYGNFGFIRNIDTMQFTGVAPIYDNGTSLWNKETPQNIGKVFTCRAFTHSQDETAKLITNYDLIDLNKLHRVDELVETELSKNTNLPDKRIQVVATAVKTQVEKLQKFKDSIISKK
jgi:hypothetical protein